MHGAYENLTGQDDYPPVCECEACGEHLLDSPQWHLPLLDQLGIVGQESFIGTLEPGTTVLLCRVHAQYLVRCHQAYRTMTSPLWAGTAVMVISPEELVELVDSERTLIRVGGPV